MNKEQFDKFSKELTKNGYKRIDPTTNSRGEKIETSQRPYWWKTVVRRPDSDGDNRSVVVVRYEEWDLSRYDVHIEHRYSISPSILISRNTDERYDIDITSPRPSIQELEEMAMKFFDSSNKISHPRNDKKRV